MDLDTQEFIPTLFLVTVDHDHLPALGFIKDENNPCEFRLGDHKKRYLLLKHLKLFQNQIPFLIRSQRVFGYTFPLEFNGHRRHSPCKHD